MPVVQKRPGHRTRRKVIPSPRRRFSAGRQRTGAAHEPDRLLNVTAFADPTACPTCGGILKHPPRKDPSPHRPRQTPDLGKHPHHRRQGMKFNFTKHALRAMEERQIPPEWVEQTINHPELRIPDRNDSELDRFYRRIPEFGNRVLRVAVNTRVESWRVVSVFFDRTMKGKL